MIKTGLPYNMNEMDEIKENGAIVNMADIKFPGVPDDKTCRTAFIFFRNTGFDVTLDFSACSFDQKEKFLLGYLTENIDIKQSEFAKSYIKILNMAVGNDVDSDCILTNEEIHQFLENNNEFIGGFLKFTYSLPLFAMFCSALNDKAYDMNEFEKTDEEISNNFHYIIKSEGFVLLFDHETDVQPVFYEKLFTFENRNLLMAIHYLPFFAVLHGLCTEDSKAWDDMFKSSNELNAAIGIEDEENE